jgi:glycosyltransferase involved in cell wall biosynthesis
MIGKRILQIGIEINYGSTGTIAEAIGKKAILQGWTSYVAYGRYMRPSSSNVIKIGNWLDNFIHGLQTRFFDRHGLGSRYATKKLIKQIRFINPDVIHLHNLHGYYINIEFLFDFLATLEIPVIWTLHDCWPFTGHCTHFDFLGCEKWKNECNNCPQIKEYPKSFFWDGSRNNFLLKRKLFNSVSDMTVVSVSNWLDNQVEKSFLGKLSRVVIYNGVDVNLFRPGFLNNKVREKYNILEKFVILGLATTWNNRKGFQDFIEVSKHIGSDDIIILVGLNTSQLKNLPNNIIGIKRIEDQSELRDFYVSCDVVMNLSVEETFGLITAEALACGTPAIVYNATASPELVDVDTGIVVEKRNIPDLLQAIHKIKVNGKDYYSKACRERAIKLFDKDIKFNEYLDLYNRKLKKLEQV